MLNMDSGIKSENHQCIWQYALKPGTLHNNKTLPSMITQKTGGKEPFSCFSCFDYVVVELFKICDRNAIDNGKKNSLEPSWRQSRIYYIAWPVEKKNLQET